MMTATKNAEKVDETIADETAGIKTGSANSDDGISAQKAIRLALVVMRLAVFVDAANLLVMGPNLSYAVLPGWHEDSFSSTGAFGFAGAQYFITMTSDFGGAIGSYFWGKMSDKYGRRICFLISLSASVGICILRFYFQDSFYTFALAGLAHGFFSPCTALGMAYASDLLPNREEKDAEINLVQAINMAGRTGGGALGILLGRVGLFVPLLAVAGLNFVATILAYLFLIEHTQEMFVDHSTRHTSMDEASSGMENGHKKPKSSNASDTEATSNPDFDDDSGDSPVEICSAQPPEAPEELDMKLLWNINIGGLVDNMGSAGLVPFCLTPVLFDAFYADMIREGEDPILSEEGFKWIYVLIAMAVVPGALVSPYLYQKIGPALACVLANVFTGCITVVLFYIASSSVTVTSFAIFVTILYCSFPFTVISQLSTGPMLDRIVPVQKRGEVQGLNMVVVNLGFAFTPFLIGNLADQFGVGTAIWTAFGFSLLAGFINLPLTFAPILQPSGSKVMP